MAKSNPWARNAILNAVNRRNAYGYRAMIGGFVLPLTPAAQRALAGLELAASERGLATEFEEGEHGGGALWLKMEVA